jgi:hypothetical protein
MRPGVSITRCARKITTLDIGHGFPAGKGRGRKMRILSQLRVLGFFETGTP